MFKNFTKILSLMVMVVLVFGLCGWTIWDKKGTKVYKIGAILPLTGPAAQIGEWQKKSIDLAIDEINIKGGIKGKKLQLIYEDSKSDSKEGISAFNKLISVEKIPFSFTCLSSVSNALIPIADKNRVNILMLAVSLPGIADKSKYAFRCNVGSDDEAKAMATFLAEDLKLKKLAVFYINDEFGIGALKVLKEKYKNAGGSIVWEDSYHPNGTDFRSSLVQIKETKAEGVYIIGYVQASAIAMKQIREVEINLPIFANMALTVPIFTKTAGSAAEGVYFTTNMFNPDSQETRVVKFMQDYKLKYGDTPNFFSAFAYDGAKMIAEAISKRGYSNEGIRQGLLAIKNFPGVVGDFDVLPNGDIKFPTRIVRFEKGKINDVKK